MAIDWVRAGVEPKVEDIVLDPIVQLVMRRDRLTVAEIMATVASARMRFRANRQATPPIAREAPAH